MNASKSIKYVVVFGQSVREIGGLATCGHKHTALSGLAACFNKSASAHGYREIRREDGSRLTDQEMYDFDMLLNQNHVL